MKKCYILRGISGSGKTTKARELAGTRGIVHSTDEYFMRDGVFCFDPKKFWPYHNMNLAAFKRSIARRRSPVVVDNCNHRVIHMTPYIDFARDAGYEVEIVEIPHIAPNIAAERSIHRTPIATIERMLQTWEPYNP